MSIKAGELEELVVVNHVALLVQLLAGIELLSGVLVPLVLATQMSITSNAVFLNQTRLLAFDVQLGFSASARSP